MLKIFLSLALLMPAATPTHVEVADLSLPAVAEVTLVGPAALLVHIDGSTTMLPTADLSLTGNGMLKVIGNNSVLESEYVDARGITRRVRTPCGTYSTAESCAKDHAAAVRAMETIYPPKPVKGDGE